MLFWFAIALVVLSLAVIWQLSDKREAANASTGWGFFSYPLQDFVLLSELKRVKQGDIETVLEPYIGASFWDLPLLEIQSKLMRLDWVVSAKVSRSWPDVVHIVLSEQEPIARWGQDGLINQNGEVFYPHSMDEFQNLVQLDGDLEFAILIAKRFAQLNALFQQQNIPLESLYLKANQVWELGIYQGSKIIFSEKEWGAQIERFLLAFSKISEDMRNSADYYDLRYSNGIVIQPKK